MDNVQQLDSIGVFDFTENRNLSDCGRRNPFILSLQSNLFQSYSVSCVFDLGFVNNSVGSFPNLFHNIVILHDRKKSVRMLSQIAQNHKGHIVNIRKYQNCLPFISSAALVHALECLSKKLMEQLMREIIKQL